MGHHLIMGRKTYESISRSLPGRTSIVVTRNPAYHAEGNLVAHSLEEALELARASGETEAFVAGGSQLFSQALGIADRIYLTRVHTSGEADVFFPEFPEEDWETEETSHHPVDEKNEHPYTFMVLRKKSIPAGRQI
jgi:dihydrofolate reductase